ncbi:MAG: DHHW family protein [Lachnospiraceae bacterium]|nr:DHHW family protein [Lachnospiraceae bacterium]
MKKIRNKSVAGVFALIIMLICVLTLLKMVRGHLGINEFEGALVGRYRMINLNTSISKLLTGGTYMESNEVLLGKDGWLFYKATSDGTPLYDYMGINHFSEEELAKVYDNLVAIGDGVSARGMDVIFMTVPNKEQVYSEYMPDTVDKINDKSRLDELTEYIESKGGLIADRYGYVDTSKVLRTCKDTYPLFYRTDTHWTECGSYLALMELRRAMDQRVTPIDEVVFTDKGGFVGDLAKISGSMDEYSDVNPVIDASSINDDSTKDQVMLIIGDSFGDAMIHSAKHFYKEVYWVRLKEYTDELDRYEPDVVVVECVERYLSDLQEEVAGGIIHP